MNDRPDDPLVWRGASAPTLAQFEVMAIEAFRRLPDKFRARCADLVIKIDDFHQTFCADLPADVAATMAVSQRPLSLAALTENATAAAATRARTTSRAPAGLAHGFIVATCPARTAVRRVPRDVPVHRV